MVPWSTKKNELLLSQRNQKIRPLMHRFWCILHEIRRVIKTYRNLAIQIKISWKKNYKLIFVVHFIQNLPT